MAENKSASRGIWASVIFFLAAMSLGFLLLASVWDGSPVVKVAVGVLCVLVIFLVVRATGKVVAAIKAEEKKSNGRV